MSSEARQHHLPLNPPPTAVGAAALVDSQSLRVLEAKRVSRQQMLQAKVELQQETVTMQHTLTMKDTKSLGSSRQIQAALAEY